MTQRPTEEEGASLAFDDAREYEYSVGRRRSLRLWVIPGRTSEPNPPAMLFYFGGGWVKGSAKQFEPQARYLASRGVTGILIDYQVSVRDDSTVEDSIDDSRAAYLWVRKNAPALGVDPDRLALSGGSAGGHLAALVATSAESSPAALVLFNPVLMLASPGSELAGSAPRGPGHNVELWGVNPESISPFHRLTASFPTTLIMHGGSDELVPVESAELFTEQALKLGVDCRLVRYAGQNHGFFNAGRDGGWAFIATLRETDRFLSSLGWISGDPTITALAKWPEQ